jgi:hypothetical protein
MTDYPLYKLERLFIILIRVEVFNTRYMEKYGYYLHFEYDGTLSLFLKGDNDFFVNLHCPSPEGSRFAELIELLENLIENRDETIKQLIEDDKRQGM